MFKYLFFMGIICATFVSFLQADPHVASDHSLVNCPKTYVSLEQVDFVENKIFVKVEDLIFQIPALYSDQTGLFFQSHYTYHFCGAFEKECSSCGLCLPFWSKECIGCGEEQY